MEQSTSSFMLVLKQRYLVTLVALLLAMGLAFVGGSRLQAAQAAPASTVHGCPAGYVCVYPQNAGWNGNRPSLKLYHYGVYQLSHQYGMHTIINNQTGGAWAHLCTDWNGKTCTWDLGFTSVGQYNLTPINSIRLSPTSR